MPPIEVRRQCPAPPVTAAVAAHLAPHLTAPLRVYLSGELGAGKTFFVRAVLNALGANEPVPSPSYALVHSYRLGELTVHHMDCYRLQGAEAGEDLLELLHEEALCLLEWSDCAANLPPADLTVHLDIRGAQARTLHLRAVSEKAQQVLTAL